MTLYMTSHFRAAEAMGVFGKGNMTNDLGEVDTSRWCGMLLLSTSNKRFIHNKRVIHVAVLESHFSLPKKKLKHK